MFGTISELFLSYREGGLPVQGNGFLWGCAGQAPADLASKNHDKQPANPNEASPAYEVGYAKPPKASRFQPGKSGNPNGRPRKAKSINALLEQALSSPVTITEHGKQMTVEQRTVLIKALVARAIKGDMRANTIVLHLMEQRGMHKEPTQIIRRIERVIVRPEPRGIDDTGAAK